jgi:hypothetical protein
MLLSLRIVIVVLARPIGPRREADISTSATLQQKHTALGDQSSSAVYLISCGTAGF